jgi:Sulfotransferase domain
VTGRLPTFLVIGAQKSATTSLVHYLGGHPDVFALTEEVHFFDRFHDRGVDWYRQHFAGAERALAVGESTPNYMYFRDAPRRMAALVPDARLIAMLRNPIDRAYSHYWHNRTRGIEPLDFDDALAAEVERLAASADDRDRGRFGYVDRGKYLQQLKRVREHFDSKALSVILTDDLERDRTGTVAALYRLLGVNDAVIPSNIDRTKNRYMTFRSQRLRGPLRRLPRPLRKVAARLNVRYAPYPPMADDARKRLVEEFREEIQALGRWLDRDLSSWER